MSPYIDWTAVLARTGLEAPGYHEAVKASLLAKEERQKSQAEALEAKRSSKKAKGRRR